MPASKTRKYYACQKPGHFERECRSKHKGSHSTSPTRNISEGASRISNKHYVRNENIICQTIVESNKNFSKEDMRSAQMADEDLNAILKAMEKEERPTWEEISGESSITKAYWVQWQSLIVEDGCLWCLWHSEDASWVKKLLAINNSCLIMFRKSSYLRQDQYKDKLNLQPVKFTIWDNGPSDLIIDRNIDCQTNNSGLVNREALAFF
uniref:CCHC-type domain-containing protein n=1 Tax=Glossina austeni TaxID=7395 RepID=A0A1A9UIB4_GLOAU